MTVGLYFGSFNPIHKGHLAIARYMLDKGYCDELWIVVSPQSPFKERETLAPDEDRLAMATLSVEDEKLGDKVKICDVEMNMPRPSWSIDTLKLLIAEYPQYRFALVMGEDNLKGFDRWKQHDEIRRLAKILVYPREGVEKGILNAPLLNYNSTEIRKLVEKGASINDYVTKSVETYILNKGIYDRR